MGTTQSCYFKSLLLGCLVQNHQLLYLGMKANEGKCLLSCNSVWPQSWLDDSLGPENDTFDFKNLKENVCDPWEMLLCKRFLHKPKPPLPLHAMATISSHSKFLRMLSKLQHRCTQDTFSSLLGPSWAPAPSISFWTKDQGIHGKTKGDLGDVF